MRILRGHTAGVRGVAYTPDSLFLASGGEDGTVRLWDITKARMISKLIRSDHERRARERVYDVAISPDGRWLASAWSDNRIRLWSLPETGDPIVLVGHNRAVTSLAFADSETLISGAGAGDSGGEMGCWSKLPTSEFRLEPIERQGVWTVAVSPVSGLVAVGTSALSGAVLLWQPKLFGPLEPGHEGSRVRSMAFAPEGKSVAHANLEGQVVVWDFSNRLTLRGHSSRVRAVTYSPDGSLLATASQDGTVRLWEVDSGIERACYDWEMGRLGCVAFAPDGMTIAAGGEREVVVWDVDV